MENESPPVDPLYDVPMPNPPKRRGWIVALIVLLMIAATGVGFVFWLGRDLPKTDEWVTRALPRSTWVLASDGTVLGELYRERRRDVKSADLPATVKNAFVAAHDPTFNSRGTLSLIDLVWAASRAGVKADSNPGGLSVPLARQAIAAKGFTDRARQWLFARELESALSKDALLTLYLNRVDLGEGGFGVEEAALHFFSKRARDLTLSEAAALASMAARPGAFSLSRDAAAARQHRDTVLEAMAANGLADSTSVAKARGEPITLHRFEPRALSALREVRLQLRRTLGREAVATGGYTIQTTIDPNVQLRSERAVRDAAIAADEKIGWRGAVASIDSALYEKVKQQALRGRDGLLDLSGALQLIAVGNVAGIAKNARVLPIETDAVMLGRVKNVSADAAEIQVGSATVRATRASAEWMFANKEGPHQLDRLIHEGELVLTRITSVTPGSDGAMPGLIEQRGSMDGAMIVLETQTGRVLSLVGSVDVRRSQFDRARSLRRSVAALAQPLVYGLGIEKPGLTAGTLIQRDVREVGLWAGDATGSDAEAVRNPVTAFEAFSAHDAEAFVALEGKVGARRIDAALTALGLRPAARGAKLRGPSGAPWAVAQLWTAVARGGVPVATRLVDKVTDASGKESVVPQAVLERLIEPHAAALLCQWTTTGQRAGPLRTSAHVGHEAWAVGVGDRWTAAICVGADPPGLANATVLGSGAPAKAIDRLLSDQTFRCPSEGLVKLPIDLDSGLRSKDAGAPKVAFVSGTEPTKFAEKKVVKKAKGHKRR